MRNWLTEKLGYCAAAITLMAVTMGLRYVSYWTTDPLDPPQASPRLSQSPAIISRNSRHTIWEVPFVTMHAFEATTGDFTGPTSGPHFGLSEVLIPATRPRGSLVLSKPSRAASPDAIHRAGDREFLQDYFFEYLYARLADGSRQDVLIFVHGFNVGFHEAICRAAQLAHDIPFDGVVIVFDWPSADHSLGYVRDRLQTGASAQQLAVLLAKLRSRLPNDVRMHVLAHSMGNHVVLQALRNLAGSQPLVGASSQSKIQVVDSPALLSPLYPESERWSQSLGKVTAPPVNHLIMAAPDVHPEDFQSVVSEIHSIVGQMTVYCSESDFALDVSRYVNGQGKRGFRLGDSRNSELTGGVDIVRVCGVSRSDPFGHAYYGSHPGLLSDLRLLLQEDQPLPKRSTVAAGAWPHGDQWYLR